MARFLLAHCDPWKSLPGGARRWERHPAVCGEEVTGSLQRSDPRRDQGEEIQLVVFEIAGSDYGVRILDVREIIRVPQITSVPGAGEAVEGIINLRGQVIPVIDLRKRLGTLARELGREARIIVVSTESRLVGVIVDAVKEVVRIPASAIEPPPQEVVVESRLGRRSIEGIGRVGDRLLILLSLSELLRVDEETPVGISA